MSQRYVHWSGSMVSVALVALAAGSGCNDPIAGLAGLGSLMPSAEELQQYEQDIAQFNDEVANLPALAVRIVNDTDLVARVDLTSAMPFPELATDELVMPDFGADTPSLSLVDTQTVIVAAHGTATGTLKCGDVLGISISDPLSLGGVEGTDTDAFGLYMPSGNIALRGFGQPAESSFRGDVLNTTRFVRPAEDGLDCSTATLVLTIEAPATPNAYDPATGALISAGKAGQGTVSAE
jgi:hypothetical protein